MADFEHILIDIISMPKRNPVLVKQEKPSEVPGPLPSEYFQSLSSQTVNPTKEYHLGNSQNSYTCISVNLFWLQSRKLAERSPIY